MALTMGLASVSHLDHVWAILEQFGQSKPVKWSLDGLSMKVRRWGGEGRAPGLETGWWGVMCRA